MVDAKRMYKQQNKTLSPQHAGPHWHYYTRAVQRNLYVLPGCWAVSGRYTHINCMHYQ